MRLCKLAALGGAAGPVVFTAAWVISSLRQPGHSAARVQLSGLAADDAADPHIMMAGFVVLGACSVAFGAVLARRVAPRSPGPWLVMTGGMAAMAAGVFRRDHMLLTGPGFAGESWHNQVHDVASAIAYTAMLVAPLLLGQRFRDDPQWAVLSRPVQGLALASASALVVFISQALEPWNGVVQRAAVTLGLAAEVALAARMLTLRPVRVPASPHSAALHLARSTWRTLPPGWRDPERERRAPAPPARGGTDDQPAHRRLGKPFRTQGEAVIGSLAHDCHRVPRAVRRRREVRQRRRPTRRRLPR